MRSPATLAGLTLAMLDLAADPVVPERRVALVVGPHGDRTVSMEHTRDTLVVRSDPLPPRLGRFDDVRGLAAYTTDFWNPSLRDLYVPPAAKRWRGYRPTALPEDPAQRARRKAANRARAITKRNRK